MMEKKDSEHLLRDTHTHTQCVSGQNCVKPIGLDNSNSNS